MLSFLITALKSVNCKFFRIFNFMEANISMCDIR